MWCRPLGAALSMLMASDGVEEQARTASKKMAAPAEDRAESFQD